MSILSLFTSHTHYWGVPHPRKSDNKLIQVCYECSAEREMKVELRPEDLIVTARKTRMAA